ncbi:MAG: rhomboid family intramembrane serine protease [Chloroflexi bacterium]|nr:rhomboid family intramembrane serine protease [Chloroflexota bacterium]
MFWDRLGGFSLLIAFVSILWVVEVVNLFLGHQLNVYGLVPRTIEGLRGIPLSPFLHGGFGHLLSNTFPLLILGGLVAARGQANFVGVTLFIVFAGGLALWAVGRPWPWDDQNLIHVGASGLVFGYFGYLVSRSWYERSFIAILVAVVVALVFGSGIFLGLLPTAPFISWEGHLCGLVAGVLIARLTRNRMRRPRTGQAA